MRIAVLGAGAMGSWFGGHLTHVGHEVHLLTTNQAHIAAVSSDGLQLRSPESVTLVHPRIQHPADFNAQVDLVLTLTKTFQLEPALRTISSALPKDIPVLSLQNGLGNAEVIATFVGLDNVWLGVTMLPVDKVAPGVVERSGQGITWFGHATGSNHQTTAKIASAFDAADLDVRHDIDIQKRVWEKVAFNAGMNAVCALTHGTPGLIGDNDAARSLVKSAAAEVALVAASQGNSVDLQSVYDTIDFACEKHGAHITSMLQDLLNGKRTEVQSINGAVTARAKQTGIDVPVNAMLATLISVAEQGHSSLSN